MIYQNGKEITPKINGVDLSRVVHNGKQVWPKIVTEIALADTKAGDVLLWDKINQKKLFTSSDNLSNYPSSSYAPIGVVVIPASHNVYGDGSCGVMSLKPMNCNTPSTGGTSEQYMGWGDYFTDISALSNLNQVPTGNTSNGIPTGQTSYAHLPSDKFSGTQCAHDTDAFYYSSSYIPSPYLTDGSRNPGYYQTSSPSSSSNALADFDGIGNTAKIITQRGTKDYNSWIPGRETPADYPAASCCDMFHTEGTQQGDWYLPACGELGYIMPPFNKINDAIDKMRQAYGSSVGVELFTSSHYWSSTEYNRGNARCVYTNSGLVRYSNKDSIGYVRAFLKVSPLDLSSPGLSPESAPNGVYVYANNGKLYNPDEWDMANNNSALGVAVVKSTLWGGGCKFIISKNLPMINNIAWSEELYGVDVADLTNATDSTAMRDFDGKSNTDIIIAQASGENSSNNASYYCREQVLNGINGYLPSSGELYAIREKKDSINNTLTIIGATTIDVALNNIENTYWHKLWSSTEYSDDASYHLSWETEYGDGLETNRKNIKGFAFPVFVLE